MTELHDTSLLTFPQIWFCLNLILSKYTSSHVFLLHTQQNVSWYHNLGTLCHICWTFLWLVVVSTPMACPATVMDVSIIYAWLFSILAMSSSVTSLMDAFFSSLLWGIKLCSHFLHCCVRLWKQYLACFAVILILQAGVVPQNVHQS